MRDTIASIKGEYRRYQALAEPATQRELLDKWEDGCRTLGHKPAKP